jgi:carbon-monoxide dehydrogenase medium subunit
MDIAVAGAGVALALDEEGCCCSARIAVGAVAATALLVEEAGGALLGSRLEQDAIDAAVAAVRAAASPISDKRASADYRRHVVGVLVARAIRTAHERIVSGETS